MKHGALADFVALVNIVTNLAGHQSVKIRCRALRTSQIIGQQAAKQWVSVCSIWKNRVVQFLFFRKKNLNSFVLLLSNYLKIRERHRELNILEIQLMQLSLVFVLSLSSLVFKVKPNNHWLCKKFLPTVSQFRR